MHLKVEDSEERTMPESHKESHHEHHHADTGPHPKKDHSEVAYWRRAHLDWKFWVGAVAIAVAIAIYVLTLDLSSVPR
jgi:ABC-type Zn2+ transport system substrate-binding protein/surface adhesin